MSKRKPWLDSLDARVGDIGEVLHYLRLVGGLNDDVIIEIGDTFERRYLAAYTTKEQTHGEPQTIQYFTDEAQAQQWIKDQRKVDAND